MQANGATSRELTLDNLNVWNVLHGSAFYTQCGICQGLKWGMIPHRYSAFSTLMFNSSLGYSRQLTQFWSSRLSMIAYLKLLMCRIRRYCVACCWCGTQYGVFSHVNFVWSSDWRYQAWNGVIVYLIGRAVDEKTSSIGLSPVNRTCNNTQLVFVIVTRSDGRTLLLFFAAPQW